MTVVKITVLETSLKKDLADEYAVPNLEPCPILKAGQVFYATNTCKGNVRRRAKWLFRDVMRPSLDSRLISAESALRSTQR